MFSVDSAEDCGETGSEKFSPIGHGCRPNIAIHGCSLPLAESLHFKADQFGYDGDMFREESGIFIQRWIDRSTGIE